MNNEELILKKLDQLAAEVAELKAASAQPGITLPDIGAQDALREQVAISSANLTKWVKSLDQMMELKEDLVPLGRPMLEEVITHLDQATQGFDAKAFRELVKQFSLNLGNLAEAIRMVGSLVELKNDSNQILKDSFNDAILRLEELKQKGFFDSMNQMIRIAELVGQRMLELDTAKVKPVKGLLGLHSAMRKKEFQEGLGVMMELVSVFSVLKTGA